MAPLFQIRDHLVYIPQAFNNRELGTLTSLEIDEHLADAGSGMSDSTRHHDAVALQRLQ